MRRLPLEQLLALVASIAVVGCTGPGAYDPMDPTEDPTEPMPYEPPSEDDFVPTPTTAGDEESTFSHPAGLGPTVTSPREALERMQEQGPPAFASRVHSCRKVRFRTIGRVLASRGVNLDADGELSAGLMYRSSDQSLGAPNYGARIPETTSLTVAPAAFLTALIRSRDQDCAAHRRAPPMGTLSMVRGARNGMVSCCSTSAARPSCTVEDA